MVEAAGVEPASEKARREKTTCVSGSLVVGGRVKNRRRERPLSPIDLGLRLRAEAFDPACENDVR